MTIISQKIINSKTTGEFYANVSVPILKVAAVILARDAKERKEKAKEGINEINSNKNHYIGEQAKIIKFLKQILKANVNAVGANLSGLVLPITDRIQTESSFLDKDNLNKIKSGTATISINIKR